MHMRQIRRHILEASVFLIVATIPTRAQITLSPEDLGSLVGIAELYSHYTSNFDDNIQAKLQSLRTPKLSHLVDALIANGRKDSTILQRRFLSRPTDEELRLWYVIREIHYNLTSKTTKPEPDTDVARKVLASSIDSRWLLDNYYYRILSGLGFLFNSADLSTHDVCIDSLGLLNETEKAILFLNMTTSLIGGRFGVLSMKNKCQAILECCGRLPTFKGRPYFCYKDFAYADFDWIGYQETESYNRRHIGTLYRTLLSHVAAAAQLGNAETATSVHRHSILSSPVLFRYSNLESELWSFYEKMNNRER